MTPTKQTVYLPVKVEDEPIPNSKAIFTLARDYKNKTPNRQWNNECLTSENYDKEKEFTSKLFSHWLKEQEGYFFTPEELDEYTQKVIKQALETAAEKAYSYAIEGEGGYMEGNIESIVVKKSITNTFEETCKLFRV